MAYPELALIIYVSCAFFRFTEYRRLSDSKDARPCVSTICARLRHLCSKQIYCLLRLGYLKSFTVTLG